MDVIDAIKTRKSIRSYTSDPVPQETLREILAAACRAPSAMNSQPWEFFVIGGTVLDQVRAGILEKFRAGEAPHEEHPVVGWSKDSVYRDRQVELAKQLFSAMGIERGDKEKRTAWMERGFRFFDAPAAVIILADKSLSDIGPALDLGSVTQTICLAAMQYGLGTCIEDQGVMYPEVLRDVAGIPDTKRIIISIAIGYPDPGFPANQVVTQREDVDRITTWCGF